MKAGVLPWREMNSDLGIVFVEEIFVTIACMLLNSVETDVFSYSNWKVLLYKTEYIFDNYLIDRNFIGIETILAFTAFEYGYSEFKIN